MPTSIAPAMYAAYRIDVHPIADHLLAAHQPRTSPG
jgi:hypothetical protein